jgi:hypothetical protein
LVSGEALRAGALADVDHYRYVQWGFFFGDLPSAGERAHTHLASWAAGEIVAPTNYQLRGSGEYEGHAIGSVLDSAGARTAVGSFTQSWNFDARTGNMSLAFDGETYVAPTLSFTAPTTDLRYTGIFRETAGRIGQVDGVLVGITPDALPGGSVGQFGIQNLPGSDPYIASGTFGGDITGP